MVAKTIEYAATAWHMEFTQGTSDKFYQVIITENGVCQLRWGRRGSVGQNSVTRYGSFEEARDQGLKQVFAKKSKGYVQTTGDFNFMASHAAVEYALKGNPNPLAAEYEEARRNGLFAGAKQTVLKQYADFAESVKSLMVQAEGGNFEATMNEYEQLEKVWEEINDKHAEVSAAMSIAKMTLMQKLMSGAL